MWATVIAWLVGTKAGRSVALLAALAIGAVVSWYVFSTHYFSAGVASCQSGRLADTNAANVAQGETNISNNETSSSVGKVADEEAADLADDVEEAKRDSQETIHEVYKKPPVTAPVAVGSCVHPLDERVQDRIGDARAAAAEARAAAD